MPQAIPGRYGGTNMVPVLRTNVAVGSGGATIGPVVEIERTTQAQAAALAAAQKVETARSDQARAHGLGSRLLNDVG